MGVHPTMIHQGKRALLECADRPNQFWYSDITYLPMRRGSLYLVAIMDWHTRKVLTSPTVRRQRLWHGFEVVI